MFKWIYLLLLLSSVILIFWQGKWEERIVMAALAVGSLLTPLLHARTERDWLTPDTALFFNELFVTIVILFIAYRSRSFWPIPVAAFQMLALLTPFATLMGQDLVSYAVGMMQGMWAYPQLLILIYIVAARLVKERQIHSTKIKNS
jgi:hypothetical protein